MSKICQVGANARAAQLTAVSRGPVDLRALPPSEDWFSWYRRPSRFPRGSQVEAGKRVGFALIGWPAYPRTQPIRNAWQNSTKSMDGATLRRGKH
jgi:hypothetical protein